MSAIRVLIADDNSVVRTGLAQILNALPDVELVGAAADGKEAIELAEQTKPDVCLLDVRMPVMNGVEATRVISERCPVVMLTHSEEHEVVSAALRNGGAGVRGLQRDRDGGSLQGPPLGRRGSIADVPQRSDSDHGRSGAG